MFIIILAIVCAAVLLILLLRNMSKYTKIRMSSGTRWEKICEIIKMLIAIEAAIFIILFIIILIKTILS